MASVYRAPVGFDPPDFDDAFTDGRFDHEKYLTQERKYIDRLAARCRENGHSPLLGEVIRWQRGDGYAQYMVWATRPLALIWLEIGDAWSVEEPLIRGLRIKDVQEMVKREHGLAALFGRA